MHTMQKKYSKNLIIIDFGTATTFDVIDSKGNYDGGIITPGIDLSLKVLSEKTAKLPLVKFAKLKMLLVGILKALFSQVFLGIRFHDSRTCKKYI